MLLLYPSQHQLDGAPSTWPRPAGGAAAATAASRTAASTRDERWIENRPAEVENRESFGHWEGDLLIFRKEAGKANVTSLGG